MDKRKRLTTKSGLDFYEASSAFQKCIRRGLEDEAMQFAVELHEGGFGEYLWKRMRVIASEDVGLGEPMACVVVRALYENWKEQHKEDKTSGKTTHRLYVAQAVLYLSRCKKSRLVDHFNIWHFRSDEVPSIPNFAYDKHTSKGKRMGRGLDHFFEEGAKLENMAEVNREQEFLEKAIQRLKQPLPPDSTTAINQTQQKLL